MKHKVTPRERTPDDDFLRRRKELDEKEYHRTTSADAKRWADHWKDEEYDDEFEEDR